MARKNKSKSRRSKSKRKSAVKRGTRMPQIEVAQTDLAFTIPAADPVVWIDTARALSRANRRKYDQGKLYANQGMTFIFRAATNVATIELKVKTAGSSWVVHNAYVKGKAMWDQMNQLVLDDNPSVAGKWHDFKIKLHAGHTTPLTLPVLDGANVALTTVGSEWTMSRFVMPEHNVNPATGEPIAATELEAVLIGPHGLAPNNKRSLVQAYQLSRATVSPDQPNVPAGMSESFFNLLTDTGSQEPELADVIEDADDNPPYDLNNYPGSALNAPVPYVQGFAAVSTAEVDGRIGPFTAECGLIELEAIARNSAGVAIAKPDIDVILHVMPGHYKGVAAINMGQ